jgi:hypothetical protein
MAQHTNRPVSGSKARSVNAAHANASRVIAKTVATTLKGVQQEVAKRAYRAANELRTASLYVLRGQRSGRRYRIPFTKQTYQASAPGEAPAVRTGLFRLSWGPHIHVEKVGVHFRAVSAIESNLRVGKYLLGDLLEDGTPRMAPRPYKQAVRDRALPKIKELYKKPYKV